MTDRHSGYIVTLAKDIREDDAEHIINAIALIRGVLSIKPVVSDVGQHIADERADRRWRDAIYNLAKEGPDA